MINKFNFLPFTMKIIGCPFAFFLNRLHGVEALSMPFVFQLNVSSFDSLENFKQYIGFEVLFKIGKREWHGYITKLKEAYPMLQMIQYCFVIQPWTALMNPEYKSRIFKNINILEVMSIVFNEEKNACYRIKCQQKYIVQECIIQYKETNFQFISRLLANANIFYYFVHENEQHVMILMDDPNYLYSMKDFNYNSNDIIDWQIKYSIKKTDNFIEGKSSNSRLSPGYRLSNALYFITRVTHIACSEKTKNLVNNIFYYNYFRCDPLNSYQVLPKPKLILRGYQSATVAFSNENQLSIDDRGRIGVIFSWDSHKTHVWAYLVQGQAGNQYGHQWLTRAGEKVLIIFYEGDPHKPFIISTIVNKKNSNDFCIINNNLDEENDIPCYHNQLIFNKEKKTTGIHITAARNLYFQVNSNLMQHIKNNYFIRSKNNYTLLKNNNISIESKKSILFKVGSSTIHLTEKYVKISAPKIILQNAIGIPCLAAARVNDTHLCPRVTANIPHRGGCISKGASSVFINGKPAARIGDISPCDILIDRIISGAPKILLEGMPIARINDKMQHGGKITSGSNNVQVGSAEE